MLTDSVDVTLRRHVCQRLARRRADPVGRARLEHPGLRAHPVGGATSLAAGWDPAERPQAQWDVHPAPDHRRQGGSKEAGLTRFSQHFEEEMSESVSRQR